MDNDQNTTIDAAITRMAEQAKVQVDSIKALQFADAFLKLSEGKAINIGCTPESVKKN